MPTVDLLVIGGGIHGACVARDASLRGLSVVLVEKDDLASGTSSRSSKLIHGGLRYLETGQFGLVREALRERAILLRTAPGFVRPVRFVLPFYKGDARPRSLVRVGLMLYDLLAGTRANQDLSASEALELEPGLPRERLLGAAVFPDAQMDDAGLVVANAMAAAAAGAEIRTRCELVRLESAGASLWRAHLGSGETIEARAVVNAAGPWLDIVRGRAGFAGVETLRRTRGTHLVLSSLSRHPLLLFAARDARVFFVLPWGDWSLVGTTDEDDDQAPDEVAPTKVEVAYLWEEVHRRWPDVPQHGMQRVFSGQRPLIRATNKRPWDNSREARLIDERGLISLAGGKFTTARHLAERAVDLVVRQLGARVAPCTTASALLEGSVPEDLNQAVLNFAIDHQFAKHLDDFIFRRTNLWVTAGIALAVSHTLGMWMGERLQWSEEQCSREIGSVNRKLIGETRFLTEVRETMP
jgi:glycerol-3-phosphate dehydrogenase